MWANIGISRAASVTEPRLLALAALKFGPALKTPLSAVIFVHRSLLKRWWCRGSQYLANGVARGQAVEAGVQAFEIDKAAAQPVDR